MTQPKAQAFGGRPQADSGVSPDRSKESVMDRPRLPAAATARIASGKARPLRIDKDAVFPVDR